MIAEAVVCVVCVVCVRLSCTADAVEGSGRALRTAFERLRVHLPSVLGSASVSSSVAASVSEGPTNDADEGTSVALANSATTECDVCMSVAIERRLLSLL